MRMHDYNTEQKEVILLIPPMLVSAEMLDRTLGQRIRSGYRCLIPDLSGHGEASGESYQSAGAEAEAIQAYLTKQGISHIRLAYGASVGGQILLELLKRKKITADHLYFDGLSFIKGDILLCEAMTAALLIRHRKAQTDRAHYEQKLGAVYGTETGRDMAVQFASMKEGDIRNLVYDMTHARIPKFSAATQKKTVFTYGEKDLYLKKAKKAIEEQCPASALRIWTGCEHCQRMTAAPAAYAVDLKVFL